MMNFDYDWEISSPGPLEDFFTSNIAIREYGLECTFCGLVLPFEATGFKDLNCKAVEFQHRHSFCKLGVAPLTESHIQVVSIAPVSGIPEVVQCKNCGWVASVCGLKPWDLFANFRRTHRDCLPIQELSP